MKRLIVNADDFGRTPGVTDGTLEAHRNGIVTSATVMVLERAAAEAIRQARERAPRLSLGLHFVLTGGGPPAAAPAWVARLAPGGRFVRRAQELPRELSAEEVRRELEAQIAIFEALAGRPPSHLDSHHHVALHSGVAPVFSQVARQKGLPARGASASARDALRQAGVSVPDHFLDGFYAEGATAANLRALLAHLPDGVSELMCHPGFTDQPLLASSSYAKEREREVEILCDPTLPTVLQKHGIQLSRFENL